MSGRDQTRSDMFRHVRMTHTENSVVMLTFAHLYGSQTAWLSTGMALNRPGPQPLKYILLTSETDRQTTCDLKTTLFTKLIVHRAVKTKLLWL